MSNKITISPERLKKLAGELRSANKRNIEAIQGKINASITRNEELAEARQAREIALCDQMFVHVDEIGLSKLIYSFTDSYNRSANRTILNNIADTNYHIPESMTELFMLDLPEISRSDTRWFVGGNRWGGSVGSHSGATSALRKHYNDVVFTIRKILETVEHHQGILEGFIKLGVTPRHYTTSTELASRAFISRLNDVSDDAVDVLVGIDRRANQEDGVVASVRNVLGVLQKNLEIAYAKGEELEVYAESLSRGKEAFDSQVKLVIYRPELLEDGKGLKNAYVEQHEERYRTLKNSLTTAVYEVADFIARPAGSRGSTIATLCAEAIRKIDEWETFIAGDVSVSIKEEHDPSIPDTFRTWGARQSQNRNLEDYLPKSVTEDVTAAKVVLREWETAFTATENYARNLTTAMDNDAHVSGLSTRVEQAIYPHSAFGDLEKIAAEVKSGLESQATAYNKFAVFTRTNIKGAIAMDYAAALQRGADYFLTVAQTIEIDFWGNEALGEIDRISLFDVHIVAEVELDNKLAGKVDEAVDSDSVASKLITE